MTKRYIHNNYIHTYKCIVLNCLAVIIFQKFNRSFDADSSVTAWPVLLKLKFSRRIRDITQQTVHHRSVGEF